LAPWRVQSSIDNLCVGLVRSVVRNSVVGLRTGGLGRYLGTPSFRLVGTVPTDLFSESDTRVFSFGEI